MKGTSAVSNATTLKSRELAAETYIPYVRHADAHTVVLKSRAVMTMIALDGIAFETADVRDINALHRDLNTLLRNIGDERLALWSHIIRRRSNEYPDGQFSNAFALVAPGTGTDMQYTATSHNATLVVELAADALQPRSTSIAGPNPKITPRPAL